MPLPDDLVRLVSPNGSTVVVPAEKARRLGSQWVPVEDPGSDEQPSRRRRRK